MVTQLPPPQPASRPLTGEAREVGGGEGRKLGTLWKCLRASARLVLGAGEFVFFFAGHSGPALRRGEGARWGLDAGD